MTLTPGSEVGTYRITGLLGAGGMGEVYRARDSRLGREVAIKVLASARWADPERRSAAYMSPEQARGQDVDSRTDLCKKLAFVAISGGKSLLWMRSLDSATVRALSGTEGASLPFWSPDGRAIGFFADRKLKRIDVDVGAIQVLARAEGGRGGSWGA